MAGDSELKPFKAKYRSECAHGVLCGNIQIGDDIVRLPVPAALNMPYAWQRRTGKMYKEVNFSHLKCYQEAEARRNAKAALADEQGNE